MTGLVGWPPCASAIVAVNSTVFAPASESSVEVAAVSVMTTLPRVASIGTWPVSGVSATEIVGLDPDCTFTVAARPGGRVAGGECQQGRESR